MVAPCENLDEFFDGELDVAAATAFRDHLLTCRKCQAELGELIQLGALSDRYHRARSQARIERVPAAVRVHPGVARRWVLAGGAGLSLAAVAVIAFVSWNRVPDLLWSPAGAERLIEGRSSYARATGYRPMRGATLGPDAAASSLQHGLLARLPSGQAGAFARAAAYLALGQSNLAEVALQELDSLDASADVESEQALACLVRGNPQQGDYEKALRLTDAALEKSPRHGPALFNKALALRELGLDMLAARTFDAVAELGEAGWSQEARLKADQLRRSTSASRERWRAAILAGEALLTSGALPPPGLADSPILRQYFYEAVRSRVSPSDVEALMPLARDLDSIAGDTALEDYVRAVARRDFSVRGPLARRYLQWLTRHGEVDARRLVADLHRSTEEDILAGALAKVEAPAGGGGEQAAPPRRLLGVADPWFEALSLEHEASVARQRGDLRGARQKLEQALEVCRRPGLEFRWLDVQLELSEVLLQSSALDEAYAHAIEGWRAARRVNEWGHQAKLIEQLARIARLRDDGPLARAYHEEANERAQQERP